MEIYEEIAAQQNCGVFAIGVIVVLVVLPWEIAIREILVTFLLGSVLLISHILREFDREVNSSRIFFLRRRWLCLLETETAEAGVEAYLGLLDPLLILRKTSVFWGVSKPFR